MQQSQHTGSLAGDVFKHNMGGKVDVHVVSALDAAHQLIHMVQGLGVLLFHQTLHLGAVNAFGHLGDNARVHHGVGGQFRFGRAHELFVQIDQLEYVADLHQHQELVLRHNLAEFAIALRILPVFPDPGLLLRGQLFRRHVADIRLVGHISHNIFIRAEMLGQLLQIFGFRVDDHFCGLCSAGVQHHVRRMHQHIACAFDNAVHFVHCLSANFSVFPAWEPGPPGSKPAFMWIIRAVSE